jgi:hypothetical protein
MNTLNDSLVVGILLTLVFGAICFYLYSRLIQSEKRVGLLENLLLDLKFTTESTLAGPELLGPDSVEPVSGPAPLEEEDVDETFYENVLRSIPGGHATESAEHAVTAAAAAPPPAVRAPEGLIGEPKSRSPMPSPSAVSSDVLSAAKSAVAEFTSARMENNYESMSVKELQAAVKQRGISPVPRVRKELIEVLKRSDAGESTQQGSALDSFLKNASMGAGQGQEEQGFELQLESTNTLDEQFSGKLTDMEEKGDDEIEE